MCCYTWQHPAQETEDALGVQMDQGLKMALAANWPLQIKKDPSLSSWKAVGDMHQWLFFNSKVTKNTQMRGMTNKLIKPAKIIKGLIGLFN